MTRFLSVDEIGRINERNGGGGLVSADRAGVEGAAERPRATFDGHELYSTVWDKAGALLHALASAQYFVDGNKRTAWLAALAFLRANDCDVPPMAVVEAEAFVLAVATVHDFGPERAAEWLLATQMRTHGRLEDPRLEYVILCKAAHTDEGALSLLGGHMATLVGPLPGFVSFTVALRIHWRETDMDRAHEIGVSFSGYWEVTSGPQTMTRTMSSPARGGHAHHPRGRMPTIVTFDMVVWVEEERPETITVGLDGQIVAVLPLNVLAYRPAPWDDETAPPPGEG